MASGFTGERHWHAARGWLWLNQEVAQAEIEASQTDSGPGTHGLCHRRRPGAGAFRRLSDASAQTNRTGKSGEFDRRCPRSPVIITARKSLCELCEDLVVLCAACRTDSTLERLLFQCRLVRSPLRNPSVSPTPNARPTDLKGLCLI